MPADRIFAKSESDRIREYFPVLSDHIFLNAAGIAPLPTVAKGAMQAMIESMSQKAYLDLDKWIETMRLARKQVANLLGAQDGEIAFTRNTSDGVSLVASGLRLGPGDEVIINDLEFPSNVYPWLNLESKGVVVKVVKSENGRVTVDSVAKAVTPKTRVLAISSVQYQSGYRTDLAGMGALARQNGFLFFVDAIQSLGVIPLDVKEAGVDFLSCGGFKWLCGPIGSGLFFCDQSRLDELELSRVGWNSVRDSHNYAVIDFTLKKDAQRFEEGSPNLPGICGLYESVKLLMSKGIERNHAHVIALTDRLVDGLLSKGAKVLSPREEGEKSGIVIFSPPDPADVAAVSRQLSSANIMVIPRGAGLRASPHFYNTIGDIDTLLEMV